MLWVDAEVAVSPEVMVDLLCTTCGCLPSFEPSCEVSVFISMSPLYMRLQIGKWPEILNPEVFLREYAALHASLSIIASPSKLIP